MTYTKTTLKALLGATALTVFAAGTAQAQHTPGTENNFTPADTPVSNTFTLNYSVGGTSQPPIDNTGGLPNDPDGPTVFTVDRLIDLTVNSEGDTTVVAGATDEQLVFSVVNDGNDSHDYALSIVEETAGDTIDTDNPASAVEVIRYYIDDGDGIYEPGTGDGALIDYDPANPPNLAPDDVLWVVVTQDIPTTAVDGNTADVSLLADTLDETTHVPVTGDTDGNDTDLDAAAENVLADGQGTASTEGATPAGDHSATGTYIVATADIAATKSVAIHSEDGSTCATIPGTTVAGYFIPGACVEYVISVENTGSNAASSIIINDVLDSNLRFATAAFGGDFTGGAFSSPALPAANTDCTGGACVINLTGATLPAPTGGAASTTGTVTIRAYVK